MATGDSGPPVRSTDPARHDVPPSVGVVSVELVWLAAVAGVLSATVALMIVGLFPQSDEGDTTMRQVSGMVTRGWTRPAPGSRV